MRVGRHGAAAEPERAALALQFWKYYGDSMEIEHDHVVFGQAGAVRFLAYQNYEDTGRFNEAIAAFEADPRKNAASCGALYNYGSGNFTAPDLCWVRRGQRQGRHRAQRSSSTSHPTSASSSAAMYSDGRSEVDAYDSADRLVHARGARQGLALASAFRLCRRRVRHELDLEHPRAVPRHGRGRRLHRRWALAAGAREANVDVFYSVNLLKALWLSADYQHIWNPGVQRGPRSGRTSSAGGSMRSSRPRAPSVAWALVAALAACRVERRCRRRSNGPRDSGWNASTRPRPAAAGSSWTISTCAAGWVARWRCRPAMRAIRCGSRRRTARNT